MADRDSTLMQRREFVQSSAAATAAAVTMASLGPAQVEAQTGAGQPQKASAGSQVLPKRMFGKTGVEVTILNAGTLRVAGFMDRLLRLAYSRGVRFFDTAKVYGTEPGFKKWFAQMPEVRKQIFLATKEPVRGSETSSRTSTSGSRRWAPTTLTCSITTDWDGVRSTGSRARR